MSEQRFERELNDMARVLKQRLSKEEFDRFIKEWQRLNRENSANRIITG
jgi:hypothetical protein